MNINTILPGMYRMQLRDILTRQAYQQTGSVQNPSRILFADTVTTMPDHRQIPPAPQGIGEIKHSVVDRKDHAGYTGSPDTVPNVEPRRDDWDAETEYRYRLHGRTGGRIPVRRMMEDRIRKVKKAGLPCPYTDENHLCSAVFIRCGERGQYATPETDRQKKMGHPCLYLAGAPGRDILIVDDNRRQQEFCQSTLELFFHYTEESIQCASTGTEALEKLAKEKLSNRSVGLALIDISLPDMSGYQLVNECYKRDFNIDVILLGDPLNPIEPPPEYYGNKEIIPRHAMVCGKIDKPFHSDSLIAQLKTLGFVPYSQIQ